MIVPPENVDYGSCMHVHAFVACMQDAYRLLVNISTIEIILLLSAMCCPGYSETSLTTVFWTLYWSHSQGWALKP